MGKKPNTTVNFVEEFVKQQGEAFSKAIIDPSVNEVLLKSPETAPLYQISTMLEGIMLVQASIADRLLDIEKLLMKEV